MLTMSDETLLARVVQQDVAALENLYDRHAASVLGVLMQVMDDRAAAEDLLQEIFWQVWHGAATYSALHVPFRSWLFRIARRMVLETTERRHPRSQESFESTDVNPANFPFPDSNQGGS